MTVEISIALAISILSLACGGTAAWILLRKQVQSNSSRIQGMGKTVRLHEAWRQQTIGYQAAKDGERSDVAALADVTDWSDS